MPLKHVFLSKDGIKKEAVWYGFAGPVYRKLRVFRPASQPTAGLSARPTTSASP
jgi:hypothetical protein